MENNLYDFETAPPARPSFLTVLCILTFIGSGWGILSNVWAYSTASQTSKELSKITTAFGKDSVRADSAKSNSAIVDSSGKRSKFFEFKMAPALSKMFTEANLKKAAISKLIAAMLTLLGAVLMWRLNKKGFYIYVAGILIEIIVPFILYGDSFIAVGMSSFGGFFGLLFIALYALNLKSMTTGSVKNGQHN